MAATSDSAVVLGRRQLFILPTYHGWLFALLLVVLLLAAINYGNGLVFGLTFLLAAVGVVSMLHTHRNLHRLRVSAVPAAAVFAGESARFPVVLGNDSDAPRHGIVLDCDGREAARVDIAARAATTALVAVRTRRRGYTKLPALTLATRYPLGLLYSWSRRLELGARVLVYPAPASEASLATRAAESAGEGTTRPGEGDDFLGQREFRAGDSLKHVNWKALARAGSWLTKEFGGSGGGAVWLDWDDLAGLDTETRLSVLCRGVLDASRQGLAYGLRLPDGVIAPGGGEAHQARCLEALALFKGQS